MSVLASGGTPPRPPRSRGGSRPPQASGKIIPLMPGISRAGGERREMLRAAVIQVVRHLVLRTVPPSQRVPLFDQATGLLDEAGWVWTNWSRRPSRDQARTRCCRPWG